VGRPFQVRPGALLDDGLIESAVDRDRPLELPYRSGTRYAAFADASGGRHDAFTICIGHREGEFFVADVIRGRKPPFDPKAVVEEFSALVKSYRIRSVRTDNYSAEWVAAAFRDTGLQHELAPMPRSRLYLEALPAFAQGRVRIPDLPILMRERRLLERRTSRSGRDAVDHPAGGSDDHANALVGAMQMLAAPMSYGAISVPLHGFYGSASWRATGSCKAMAPLGGVY
jgi:hypothetical protein